MTMAANLTSAAALTYDQMRIKALITGSSIKTQLTSFIAAVNPIVPDSIPNNRPVGNWLIPMAALAQTMRGLDMSLSDFNLAVDYVSKLCSVANVQRNAGLITVAQGTALLAAWNTAFGT